MHSAVTSADRVRIANAIAAVEQTTAGEIVVAVVPSSGDYTRPRAAAATLLLLAFSVLVIEFGKPLFGFLWLGVDTDAPLAAWLLLSAQAPLAVTAWSIAGWPPLLRRIVPTTQLDRCVSAAARAAFVAHGVTNTRDRSGVLIFVSEFERRVEIIADRGIHERVGTDRWQHHVNTIVAAIRAGQAADGIVAAIDEIGLELRSHFPRRADDRNELPDSVRTR